MPGPELEDVARDEIAGVDDAQRPAADHRRAWRIEAQDRVHRAARAKLRREAERGVDREHRGNGRRLDEISEEQRHHRGGDEQQHDDAAELVEEDLQSRRARCGRQAVGAVPRETLPRFVVGETRSA
ncbi:MAG: hypothetical protein A3H29_16820 [Acidobacteria bacterium RIFCSPLOWO2_02_FULL_67_21]|nr:MAG: hypothetical protein A3H29_16820 [Acidobacteria bacterium RIFCSPLOWO2_02_FULL_67_21]